VQKAEKPVDFTMNGAGISRRNDQAVKFELKSIAPILTAAQNPEGQASPNPGHPSAKR